MKYMFILIYSYCVVMFLYVCMSEFTINALTTHTARVFLWTNACASIREVSLVQAHIGASLLVVKQLDSIEQFKTLSTNVFPQTNPSILFYTWHRNCSTYENILVSPRAFASALPIWVNAYECMHPVLKWSSK